MCSFWNLFSLWKVAPWWCLRCTGRVLNGETMTLKEVENFAPKGVWMCVNVNEKWRGRMKIVSILLALSDTGWGRSGCVCARLKKRVKRGQPFWMELPWCFAFDGIYGYTKWEWKLVFCGVENSFKWDHEGQVQRRPTTSQWAATWKWSLESFDHFQRLIHIFRKICLQRTVRREDFL